MATAVASLVELGVLGKYCLILRDMRLSHYRNAPQLLERDGTCSAGGPIAFGGIAVRHSATQSATPPPSADAGGVPRAKTNSQPAVVHLGVPGRHSATPPHIGPAANRPGEKVLIML